MDLFVICVGLGYIVYPKLQYFVSLNIDQEVTTIFTPVRPHVLLYGHYVGTVHFIYEELYFPIWITSLLKLCNLRCFLSVYCPLKYVDCIPSMNNFGWTFQHKAKLQTNIISSLLDFSIHTPPLLREGYITLSLGHTIKQSKKCGIDVNRTHI